MLFKLVESFLKLNEYIQNSIIRKLEILKYRPYVGITSIFAEEFDIDKIICCPSEKKEQIVSKAYSNDNECNFTVFNLAPGEQNVRFKLLPLQMIMQSELMLNSISIQQIDLTPIYPKQMFCCSTLEENPYTFIFDKNKNKIACGISEKISIPFFIWLIYKEKEEPIEYKIEMKIQIVDLNGNEVLMNLYNIVTCAEDTFILSSNRSKII